ncbi:hypothetical protein [Actinophytocola sp. NPDC049390]|uniref:hypothetical protein n=1 Tax=Actinophytocola sp. NPDC049390 TaxID=3363894 RepID=UPI0037BE151D
MTDEATAAAIARALGEELRRVREARGWSRAQFVKGLPSQIGDRTLLSYVWDGDTLVYGWGELHLDEATPHIGARWTDGGQPRDVRHLKSRGAGEGRTVPVPPDLTRLLWEHIERYGFGADDLLFRGTRGGPLPMITYTRAWRAARRIALTEEAQATPLAARPYDLRHAAVSTWLSGGADPALVAEWAGHSLAVLMEVYAACLYGQDVIAKRRIQEALGH